MPHSLGFLSPLFAKSMPLMVIILLVFPCRGLCGEAEEVELTEHSPIHGWVSVARFGLAFSQPQHHSGNHLIERDDQLFLALHIAHGGFPTGYLILT